MLYNIFFYLTHAHSPLHIAAKSGLVVVVKDLINRGADLNVRDGDGKNMLSYSVYCRTSFVQLFNSSCSNFDYDTLSLKAVGFIGWL